MDCPRMCYFVGERSKIFAGWACLYCPIILHQQQLFCKQDEPVWCHNGETASLLWAEAYIHLVFRVLTVVVTVRTNRLHITNPNLFEALYLYDNSPPQYSLIGSSNDNKLCSLRGTNSIVIKINFHRQHAMKTWKTQGSITPPFL